MKSWSWIGAAALLSVAAVAMADKAGPAGSGRAGAKDAHSEARDARKDGGVDAASGATARLEPARAKLRETRAERRKTHATETRDRYKNIIGRQDVREQLRAHARREARLQRMRELAVELGKTKLVERIDALVAKEQAHFDRKMDELQKGRP